MSEQATPPSSPYNSTSWWTISSDTIMEMLYAVKNGRSPESVYVQAYNEATHDDYSGPQWGPDSPGYDEMGQ
jgi:hypothetical protein